MTMYTRSWTLPYAVGGVGRTGFVAEHELWTEEQAAAAERVEAALDQVDLVRFGFGDPHGLVRSKRLTVEAFRSVLRNGMDFSPGPFLFDTGHAVAVDFQNDPGVGVDELAGAGNFVLVPDPLTFQVLPGTGDAPRVAIVLGDEYLRDGTPHPLSSRNALRRVLTRYAERQLTPVLGLEVEWYLTRRLPGVPGHAGNGFGLQGEAPRVEAVDPGYQFNGDLVYGAVSDVTDPLALHLLGLGLPLRSMEHESGPGQVETTFNPMSALDTADAMLLFRTLVKQYVARSGHHASFMSLPRIDGFDPSGWHLNQSVVDASGRNVFAAEGLAAGLSAEGKAYAEGLLDRARDFCLMSVPTVNGYRRLGADFSLSPTKIGWSFEDRGAMLRVVGAGKSTHIENRVGEPCANPYLNIAAQLFAGFEGLTGSSAPGATAGAETVPQTLGESIAAFEAGPRAQDLLGAPLKATMAKLKRSELDRYQAWCTAERPAPGQVTDWEQREYFEFF